MIAPRTKLPIHNRIFLTLLIGLITFIASMYLSNLTGLGAGDLRYSLWPARDWLAGKSPYLPYELNQEYDIVPYPFTSILASIPLVWLPDRIAAGIFTCLGSMLLCWLILARGNNWQLLMLASWPFVNSVIFSQWAPYIVSMFFTPNLLPFLFIKPQQALPFVITQKPKTRGVIIAVLFFGTSLLLYPRWPLDWWKTLNTFIGYPPLFVLPFGLLLLLALIRYRDKRTWLLLLMAIMPQRMVYDQLGVLLVADNRKEMLFLVICSWISFPALIYFGGWNNLPFGWKQWVLFESYIPSLLVVLSPIYKNLFGRISQLIVSTRNS